MVTTHFSVKYVVNKNVKSDSGEIISIKVRLWRKS